MFSNNSKYIYGKSISVGTVMVFKENNILPKKCNTKLTIKAIETKSVESAVFFNHTACL